MLLHPDNVMSISVMTPRVIRRIPFMLSSFVRSVACPHCGDIFKTSQDNQFFFVQCPKALTEIVIDHEHVFNIFTDRQFLP